MIINQMELTGELMAIRGSMQSAGMMDYSPNGLSTTTSNVISIWMKLKDAEMMDKELEISKACADLAGDLKAFVEAVKDV